MVGQGASGEILDFDRALCAEIVGEARVREQLSIRFLLLRWHLGDRDPVVRLRE